MASKAVFLDRDGTIIEDTGYINQPDQVKLLSGAAEALNKLRAMGYKLVVVTNQSGVARGILTEETLGEIHERLKQLLLREGASLDRIYYCAYHPEAVIPKYRREHSRRKPNPGMILAAAEELDIDISESWMIGDGEWDIQAGLKAGCRTILISPSVRPGEQTGCDPDYKAVNLREAMNIIKQYNRSVRSAGQVEAAPGDGESSAKRRNKPAGEVEIEGQEQLTPAEEVREVVAEAVAGAVRESAEDEQPEIQDGNIEHLLGRILEQLKAMQRREMFGEFSGMRLVAGAVQVVVLFCLLLAIWFLIGPERQDNGVLVALGFALLLQVMALTFYMMQGRR